MTDAASPLTDAAVPASSVVAVTFAAPRGVTTDSSEAFHLQAVGSITQNRAIETWITPSGDPLPSRPAGQCEPPNAADRFTSAEVAADGLIDSLMEGTAIVCHQPDILATLLDESQAARHPAVFDTHRLAVALFPLLPNHSLPGLQDRLGLPAAGNDAEVLLHLWSRIEGEIRRLPHAAARHIDNLLATLPLTPYRKLFRHLTAERPPPGEARGTSLESLLPAMPAPDPREDLPEPDTYEPIEPEAIAECLGPGGHFTNRLAAYEHRPGQVAMARAVAEAFNTSTHLMVEAGTGTGKSLAYLVPAVQWALTNRTPVIISTNTKNLQSQLFDKDLPLIRDMLDTDFRAALIKGRTNYLCLRKLLYLLDNLDMELDSNERLAMTGVLVWATQTRSGDLSENALWGEPRAISLLVKLTSTGEECLGRACRHARRCFLRRARAQSLAADIVVANHSLVFAEMNIVSPALPPHAHVVFDEAHNLEEAATRHFAVEVSRIRIRIAISRLWRRGRRKTGTGLLPSLLRQVETGAFGGDEDTRQRVARQVNAVSASVQAVNPAMDGFFSSLHGLLTPGADASVCRIYPGDREEMRWTLVTAAKQVMVAALGTVAQSIERLVELLDALEPGALPFYVDFARDLNAAIARMRELSQDIEFVLLADDDTQVFWVEESGRTRDEASAWAAPIDVGQRLADELYAPKQSIILCSATLSVNGSFHFLKGRLGLARLPEERLRELDVGSPFDYARQCTVLVPMFLCDPGARDEDYPEALADLLARVFRKTRGRAMTLFTSYDMLRRTTARLESLIGDTDIQVLAQGLSGSRENITATFRHDLESVLMGTHSFWEGVDIAGETLSCLVVARLPFAVFTDPIIKARCDQVEAEGKDAFLGYSLPSAVIRFRQGFGRLIRHRTDRGIVIVADRRIATRRYGRWFKRSIPASVIAPTDPETFLDAIDRFFEDEGP